MSRSYLNIFSDLLEVNPNDPIVMPDPYNEQRSLSSNIREFYQTMRWSLRTGNRLGALVNAYYLGYLLEKRASTPLERRKCRRLLTSHYILACTRVYNLFLIVGIQQIYRSQRSSYWMFRKVTRQEYCQLLSHALTLI